MGTVNSRLSRSYTGVDFARKQQLPQCLTIFNGSLLFSHAVPLGISRRRYFHGQLLETLIPSLLTTPSSSRDRSRDPCFLLVILNWTLDRSSLRASALAGLLSSGVVAVDDPSAFKGLSDLCLPCSYLPPMQSLSYTAPSLTKTWLLEPRRSIAAQVCSSRACYSLTKPVRILIYLGLSMYSRSTDLPCLGHIDNI